VKKVDFMSSELIFGFDMLCSGNFSFFLMLEIKLDAPNKPERRGRRGWFMFMNKVEIPKNPERRKTIRARNLFLLFAIM